MTAKSRPGRDPSSGAAPSAPKTRTSPPPLKSGKVKKPSRAPVREGSTSLSSVETEAFTPVTDAGIIATPIAAGFPIPASVRIPEGHAAPSTFASESCALVTVSETHPAEIFLRGVLESLAPEGALRLSLNVDPGSFDLPAEKLFYFSHALQLLVGPLECPVSSGQKLQKDPQSAADLTVRLGAIGPDRHSLRIFDKGLYFSRYLSDISLEAEALRPLVLFVVKRHGSISIKQRNTVEFEIIG